MVLSFLKIFVTPILENRKIHTIRDDDANRWHSGRKIHFATGVRTKYYNQFHFDKCVSTQDILILPDEKRILVDGYQKTWSEKEEIARNDGFDNQEQLYDFFRDREIKTRKLIHWTDKRY